MGTHGSRYPCQLPCSHGQTLLREAGPADRAGAHGQPQDHTPVGPAAWGSAPVPWGSRQSLEKRVMFSLPGPADACRWHS